MGVGGQRHAPAALGSWVSPRAGLDGCGKSRLHRYSIPRPSSPLRVAIQRTDIYNLCPIPTELSRPSVVSGEIICGGGNDYSNEHDFGTWKVYCVSNVTFHAEFKYTIKILTSPTGFVQWHFLLLIFRNFRYFFSDIIIREPIFWMVLNRGWSQTIYHYQINSCMCSETRSEWNKRWVMVLDILLRHTKWCFINTPVLHRHSLCMHPVKFHFVLSTV